MSENENEDQRKRIETREYLMSTEPWTVPEWNDYARIRQKGKRFRGAPIGEMNLNPDEVYMIEADLRGIISSGWSVETQESIRTAFIGVDLTGAMLDQYMIWRTGRVALRSPFPDYTLGKQFREVLLTKKNGKPRENGKAFYIVEEMSISAARRLGGQDYRR